MITVEMPNDIIEHKPKFLLNFTGRQVGAVLVTAFFILLDWNLLKPHIGDELAVVLALIPAFIGAMFGWGDKFTPGHIPFEKYMKSIFVQTFIAPKTRRYRTTTSSMVVPCNKYYSPIPDSALSPELLEQVNYVRKHTGMILELDTADGITAKKGSAKKAAKKVTGGKYKKSKLAML